MKILDVPQSGKRGNIVAYPGRYGLCHRQYIVPKNTLTPAREHMRGEFGRFAQAWGRLLTQAQREAWNVAGPKVQSKKRLSKSGPLTGQQHFQGISSARACIGKEMLSEPPAPVVFGLSPVGQLTITKWGRRRSAAAERNRACTRGHHGVWAGAMQRGPNEAPERGLPGPAAGPAGRRERHH
jgi:hypothetical protein